MKLSAKKQLERRHIDHFRAAQRGFPIGDLVECEEPDFLVVAETRIIGIELTDLYWATPVGQGPQQAGESIRYKIAKTAEAQYTNTGMPPLCVSIHFSPNYTPKKADVTLLATSISNWACANTPALGAPSTETYNWDNRAYFPQELNVLSAHFFESFAESFFSNSEAAFIPVFKTSDIKRVLARKEPKVTAYLKKCSEVWLVINCDTGNLSTTFVWDETVLAESYVSGFARAFILRNGIAHELQLRR